MESELLVILTDQDGVFNKNPREYPDAKLIREAMAGDTELDKGASGKGTVGRGGMLSKLSAAKIANRSSTHTVIAPGRCDKVLLKIKDAEDVGTILYHSKGPIVARKQWIAALNVSGNITVDAGAVKALLEQGKSLLPIGVSEVVGQFERGEAISILSPEGQEIARGLVGYSSKEVEIIKRKSSRQIHELLGYSDGPELIHRDNLVCL
jgi:glutamate 5-kinase